MDRYEEALAKARTEYEKARKQGYTWLMDLLEGMFPDLRESEDERIRKWIIEEFKLHYDFESKSLNPMVEKALAWLEKQKEYPTNEEMLRTLRVEYEKGVADTIAKYEQKEQKSEWSKKDDEMRISILQEIANIKDAFPKINIQPEFDWLKSLPERFNLQSKQEWSEDYNEEKIQTRFAFYTYKDDPSVLYLSNVFVEETSRNHGFGTKILKTAEKVAEAVGATTIRLKAKQNSPANAWYRKNGYRYVTFEDGYDWLEKNLEYVNPNEQDWSKEDERKLRAVISLMKSSRAVDPFYDKMLLEGWLKSLPERFNLQPKQGWSEEDEEMRGTCIDLLEHFPRPCGEVIGPWKDCIAWLKSLRPPQYCENCKLKRSVENWKPSKEQIGMLLAVINDPNNASAESCHLMLQSLYADLEKL